MRALLVLVALWACALGSLTQTRSQNRELQRAVSHKHLTLILEGVRERTLTTVQPDPILLIDFPEINYQFKVRQIPLCILAQYYIKWLFQIHLLEDTSELKISLKYSDGETWCENIVVPELKLLQNSADSSDDHLVIVFDQKAGSGGADLTIYFSCIAKGRVHMPLSLREMIEKVKHSKVKIYHGSDIELTVSALKSSFIFQIAFILPLLNT